MLYYVLCLGKLASNVENSAWKRILTKVPFGDGANEEPMHQRYCTQYKVVFEPQKSTKLNCWLVKSTDIQTILILLMYWFIIYFSM